MPEQKPQVVIVGGGFGGLRAAQGLKSAPVDVTLIDRRNYHLFQPLLYQVATGSLSLEKFRLHCEAARHRHKNQYTRDS
jgi:NADH:quinone reductase (non-electrogenic)